MALSSRSLEPEWLDQLPPQDPRAVRARLDLRRVNAIMGNARYIARHLEGTRIADLGAGDGSLMRAVERHAGRRLEVTPVDLAVGREALAFLRETPQRFDAIVANLFLHHLADDRLVALFDIASRRAPLFIACEPRRSRFALAASRLVGLLGANDVTRHDAVASVRAGFTGEELSRLWPQGPWQLTEKRVGLFSHLFVARQYACA